MAFARLRVNAVNLAAVTQDVNFSICHRRSGNERSAVRPRPHTVGIRDATLATKFDSRQMSTPTIRHDRYAPATTCDPTTTQFFFCLGLNPFETHKMEPSLAE